MGFFEGLVDAASFGTISGRDFMNQDALLSGIPFLGEGFAQEDQQRFNAFQAKEQRDWVAARDDTKHQREIKDLEAAGLNPILSAGNVSTTPQGSSAQSGISSGGSASAKMLQAAFRRENKLAKTEIQKKGQETKESKAREKREEATAQNQIAQSKVAKQQEQNFVMQNASKAMDLKVQKEFQVIDKWIDSISRGAGAVGDVIDAANPINSVIRNWKKTPPEKAQDRTNQLRKKQRRSGVIKKRR